MIAPVRFRREWSCDAATNDAKSGNDLLFDPVASKSAVDALT